MTSELLKFYAAAIVRSMFATSLVNACLQMHLVRLVNSEPHNNYIPPPPKKLHNACNKSWMSE